MKKRKITVKSLAVVLAVLMMITSIGPLSASAITFDSSKLGSDMYLTSKTNYTIAPGITETQITTNNGSGNNQAKGCAMEVDLSNPTTSVIASYKDYDATKWGMQKVRDQAAAAEAKLGVNVVAGVNGDFFNMQTGAPTGTFVMGGTAYNVNNGWPYFAILKDGTAKIGFSATNEEIKNFKESVGGPAVILWNGVIDASSDYGVDQLPRTAVGIKADGSVVFYVVDGRQSPTSCGMTFYQLASVMKALGCVNALSLDGGGSSTFLSRHEGSDELVCRNSPSDGSERVVSSAILVCSSAKPTGEFDHATLSPNNELYTPGSTVEFTAAGVDSSGAGVALPSDGTFALEDSSYGTITSDGKFTSSGKTGTVTVNYVSDGQKCGSVNIQIVVPDTFYVPKTEVSLGFEDTTDFGIVGKYKDVTVNMKAGDIIWEIKNLDGSDLASPAGTFNGLTFTTFDGVTVNANVTATCKFDSSIKATVKAVIGAMPVVMYDFEYTTDKAEADASGGTLKYIPSYNMPTFDRTSDVSSADQAEEFRKQGYPLYNWPNKSLTDQNSMKSRIVSKADGEPVRFGEHSYRIDYDYSSYNGSSNSNNYVRVTDQDYFFDGSPTAIGCWVYVPEGTANFMLYLNCCNKDGNATYMPVTEFDGSSNFGINWTGWKYVEFDLNDTNYAANAGAANAPYGFYQGCGIFWISYQEGSNKGDRTASTIYLDDIQLIYGANTADTDNPIISSIKTDSGEIKDGETVFSSNTNTFRASFADFAGKYATGIDFDEVKMFIDGVDVTSSCYKNTGDSELYYYDLKLANGVHNIEISVADIYGNITTDTRYFTVDGAEEMTSMALTSFDKSPVLGSEYKLSLTSNAPADVASGSATIKILSNFVQYWNNYRVEPSANYVIDGTPVYDATNAIISFNFTRKTAELQTDDGSIANIIFDIPTNVPEGLEVTYRVAAGSFAKADTSKSSFSGKITTTCTSPFNIKADTMVVGSTGGYIYVTDMNSKAVEGVEIYTDTNELIGTTDKDGKVFTDKFISSVATYSIYAKKDSQLSFIYSNQSFTAGGDENGAPTYVKLNATTQPSTMQSISWMSSPTASGADAVVLYATKAAYDANGDSALQKFTGKSVISEMASSASYLTNYAVRINSANISGLKPETEYVYKAGDGTNMSELKTFSTTRNGTDVNFFVIGDTQATETTNTDEITKNLAATGTDYDFGIQTGDAVDNGGNYVMWSNIAKVFSGDFLSTQDLVQVLGNHEYYGNLTASAAAEYFDLPGTENETAPLCYSVTYGNVYIAVINYSNPAGYKKAAEWLVKDAAQSNATWKVLTMHQPAYYTNPSGNSETTAQIIRNAVDTAGIDVVFSGHDHSYARTAPMTAGQVDKNGAVYYICGSTGEKSYEIVKNDSFNFACLDGNYNAVYLTASTTDTEFSIVTHEYTADGQDVILDSYTMSKQVSCTEEGHHDYIYDNGYLTCSVCGYTTPVGQYTGFIKNTNGGLMYFIGGNAKTGWLSLGDDNYYFDDNGVAKVGEVTLNGRTYTFGADGKMTLGAFVQNKDGTHSYYINGVLQRGWFYINDGWYYFSRTNGFKTLKGTAKVNSLTYTFDSNGKLLKGAWNTTETGTSYYWGPNPVTGLVKIDEDTYYFSPENYYMLHDGSITIDDVVYTFGANGKAYHIGDHECKSVVDEAVKATCTSKGLTAGSHCEVCGQVITAQEEIPMIAHKWTGGSCTEPKVCSVCGTKDTVPGHAWKDATCTSPKTCAECGVTEGTALGHDYVRDTADSHNSASCIVYKCTRCGKLMLAAVSVPTEPDSSEITYDKGDVNMDGNVNAADARIALRIAAKLEKPANDDVFALADMDDDKFITAADARKILRIAAKLDKA